MRIRLWLMVAMWMVCMLSWSQEDARWALRYTGGVFIHPVLTENPKNVDIGRGSSGFSVTGEYYLPKRWNIQAGYYRAELDYGDADRTMEGLSLGAKKYFVNPRIFAQPYLGAGMQLNWGEHRTLNLFENEYLKKMQQTRNPRISFMPTVGAEFYIFSSVAFVVEYNFVMGLNSSTHLDVAGNGYSYSLGDKGMYHYIGLGVKVTFPFRFTSDDGRTLGGIIMETIFSIIDRKIDERY